MTATSILDQLKVLLGLQGLDAQLYRLELRLREIPRETAALKAQSQKAATGLQALEQQHKALEVKRAQMEGDLGQKEAQIKKLQGQLFQVKTNKEYGALQKEIEGLKADQSVLEEEILKVMDEVDRTKARLEAEKVSLRSKEDQTAQAATLLENESASVQDSAKELEAERSKLTPKVDPLTLGRYDRILEHKEGLALVPVLQGACSGCHMAIPPQTINEIQMSAHFITCESCARILYVDPAP